MANFHDNLMAVASDEGGMLDVLRTLAGNLAAGPEELAVPDVGRARRARGLYRKVAPLVEAYWWLAFPGAPDFQPAGESASLEMHDRGGTYTLTLSFETAWGPGLDDAEALLSSLPAGDYGFAFLDAGEEDGFEEVGVLWGLHHGAGGAAAREASTAPAGALAEEAASLTEPPGDLAGAARAAAVRGWARAHGAPVPRLAPPPSRPASPRRPSQRSAFDAGDPDRFVMEALRGFPWTVGITGSAYLGREEVVEGLAPGDPVVLTSDWRSPYFDPVGIDASTADGRSFGNVDDLRGDLPAWLLPALACMLPRVRARAESVAPLSSRGRGARHSEVFLRLELADGPLSGVLDEARAVLALPPEGRALRSETPEVV